MPTLKNINPLGDVNVASNADIEWSGRFLAAGEEFECTDAQAAHFLEQAANYALVEKKSPAKKGAE